jgi:hypothetical protein
VVANSAVSVGHRYGAGEDVGGLSELVADDVGIHAQGDRGVGVAETSGDHVHGTVGGGSPIVGFVVVPLIGIFMAVLLAGLLALLSWVFEKGSTRQAASGPPTGIDDQATGRPAPPDSADRFRQIRHPGHTAEARQRHLLRPRLT